jgi:uncharacterized protein (TIGR03083 family)
VEIVNPGGGADRWLRSGGMDPATHLAHLRADIDRILLTPESALDSPVAACPGWSVADLLRHHASTFAFATAQLRAPAGADLVPFDPPPEGPALDVFSGAAATLLAAMEATDPGERRPNWAGDPRAAFWWRRMALETAIHRFDAQAAHSDPEPVDAHLASDGVDELADVFLAAAGPRGITGQGETVHLHATDDGVADGTIPGGEWNLTFTPEGVEVERGHGKGDMAARGTLSDLFLFTWNRRPVAVETFGEPDLASWWPARVSI